MTKSRAVQGLDAAVHDFCMRTRFFHEPMTESRARMFVTQHRLNSRHRNSVLKLRVATNCPDWDIRLGIIGACAEEIIADETHGGGKPHFEILEDLGTYIGMDRDEIRAARPLRSTYMAWLAYDSLMSNAHWLLGLIGNTCAERANTPGYGSGVMKQHGWFGLEHHRWKELFGLPDEKLVFFAIHEEADIEHSDLGWNTVVEHAARLNMEDAVIEACRTNLMAWETYLNGIGDAADAIDRGEPAPYC